MERSRTAALSSREAPEVPDLGLPEGTSLGERLEDLRSPGVTGEDVSAFVKGLARPLAAGETPRHRADLLLDVLEDERLCGLVTPEGGAVGPAAMEALQALGFPYALEVTPAMLTHAHRGEKAGTLMRGTPWGVLLALVSTLSMVPIYRPDSDLFLGFGALLVAPALLAALSRELGGRFPHRLFNGLQWMMGCLLAAVTGILAEFLGKSPGTFFAFGGALLTLLSAWCLRRGPPKDFTT